MSSGAFGVAAGKVSVRYALQPQPVASSPSPPLFKHPPCGSRSKSLRHTEDSASDCRERGLPIPGPILRPEYNARPHRAGRRLAGRVAAIGPQVEVARIVETEHPPRALAVHSRSTTCRLQVAAVVAVGLLQARASGSPRWSAPWSDVHVYTVYTCTVHPHKRFPSNITTQCCVQGFLPEQTGRLLLEATIRRYSTVRTVCSRHQPSPQAAARVQGRKKWDEGECREPRLAWR
ncbi:hypothetical protein ON010_g18041 [Phytophthora cinnamomi]|nr:hypothetical protein ON010_g18041 [Phytophthora cinnamomi]